MGRLGNLWVLKILGRHRLMLVSGKPGHDRAGTRHILVLLALFSYLAVLAHKSDLTLSFELVRDNFVAKQLVCNAEQKLNFHRFVSFLQQAVEQHNRFFSSTYLAQEAGVGHHHFVVGHIEAQCVSHALLSFFEVTLAQVELGDRPQRLRVTLFLLLNFEEVPLCGLRSLPQELLLVSHPFKSGLCRLSGLLLNKVVALTVSLISGNSDFQVELVALSLDHLRNGFTHLPDKVNIQLTVELVARVALEPHEGARFLEVFANNPHDGFLHLLFEDVVLALGVQLVEELFLAVLVSLIRLLERHWDL